VIVTEVETLVARAREFARRQRRTILGIVGPPGGGKSTLAQTVVTAVGSAAVLVPMDGFHLAQAELVRLGRRHRMGAPDTFDALGYIALLRRLRDRTEEVVYAPGFRREIEEPIAGAIAVPRANPLVVTEGNYLLVPDEPWAGVRPLVGSGERTKVSQSLRSHHEHHPHRPAPPARRRPPRRARGAFSTTAVRRQSPASIATARFRD
jgi:pantothenate kinase